MCPAAFQPVNEDTERMTKLADIRDRVRSGSYSVDPRMIAEAMLRSMDEERPQPTPPSGKPQMGCS